ncbi:universal stress protein [Massilia brevitalea]|uniref:universal stress protein n=1 Tax=Massilia brevitalea TaxID=442526 RepID=UPI002738AD2F|nr:universal stress protein [Massilia brevitalea]
MFKTIVVHVDDSPQFDARLQAAAWLAQAHGAHLVGSASTGLSWPAYALLTGSMAVAPSDEFDGLRAQARASLARFAERAGRLGVASLEERLVEDESRGALLLQARYADLLVTGQDGPGGGAERALPQYLACTARVRCWWCRGPTPASPWRARSWPAGTAACRRCAPSAPPCRCWWRRTRCAWRW